MCMKHFDAEKNIIWQTDMVLNFAIFCQLHLKNGWFELLLL